MFLEISINFNYKIYVVCRHIYLLVNYYNNIIIYYYLPLGKNLTKLTKKYLKNSLVNFSPIVQDGVLIGSVTHVFTSDPTKGYGLYIGCD